LRARRLNGECEPLQLNIEQAAARQQYCVKAAATGLVRASRRLDAVSPQQGLRGKTAFHRNRATRGDSQEDP